MSRLIVNADDLGYTPGVNRAIFQLHTARAVSSATAMATGAALPVIGSRVPHGLGIGCHIILVDGAPAAPPETIPSLLIPSLQIPSLQEGGRFRPSLSHFLLDLERGRIRDGEIEVEAVAQIRRLQALGFQLTHVDTHKHTHIFPRVLRPVLRAALQCGIRAIRNPFEPSWSRAVTRGASLPRRIGFSLLGGFHQGFLAEVRRAGLLTTGGALGVLGTGVLDTALLERLLAALERHGDAAECYELVCHPGFHDAVLAAQPTRLQAERERERAALLDAVPRWTGAIRAAGGAHPLITFAQL